MSGFVYVVSKGGISKIGATRKGKERADKVAEELFGDVSGCSISVMECEHYMKVEYMAHKTLSNELLSSSPVYQKEVFSISFKDAVKVVKKSILHVRKNPPASIDTAGMSKFIRTFRCRDLDFDLAIEAELLCKKAGITNLIEELDCVDELTNTNAKMIHLIATLLIANQDLSSGIASLSKQIAEITGHSGMLQ